MKKEIRFILASHGQYACSALETLEMIAGKQHKMTALSLQYGEGIEEFLEKYEQVITGFPNSVFVIFTDIFGGTPSNAALQLLFAKEDIQIFSGFNLPLLLEVATTDLQTIEEVTHLVTKNWNNYLTDINKQMKKREETLNEY
jgi:mannose/fructose/sorbose-specific phosphotransferase system IIA component